MNHSDLLKQLNTGVHLLKLSISQSIGEQLITFLEILQKWAKTHNLTAIKTLTQMVNYHLLDSLALIPYVHGQRILDVGTGAGFPGIPLALALPSLQFVLMDSQGKKNQFLLHVQARFKLSNVQIMQTRMEDYNTDLLFDTITCRALGKMDYVMRYSQHLLQNDGQWLFMKGKYPRDELKQIGNRYAVYPLEIPGIVGERHLVVVNHEQERDQWKE